VISITEISARRIYLTGVTHAETLSRAVATFQTLDQAFRWAITRTPRVLPADVVVQDEYSHDVLFRADDGSFLVFDAT